MLTKSEIKKVTSYFISWRLSLFLIGFLAQFFLKYQPSFPYSDQLTSYGLPQWVYSWANFDGVHYLTIINKGYFGTGLIQAFFPLFPMTVKVLNVFENPLIVGLIFSTFLNLVLFLTFYQFSKTFFEKNHFLNLLIFTLFPTSFFFGAFYTESLFLILVLQAFIFSHKKNWLMASIFAGLASATRIIGIFLLPALLWEYLINHESSNLFIKNILQTNYRQKIIKQIKERILNKNLIHIILLSSSGLIIYMSYLYFKFNDPIYFFHVQSEFGGGRQESLILYPQVVFRYIKILLTARPFDLKYFTYVLEFIAGTIGLLAILFSIKKFKISHLIFSLGAFFIPTLTGTFSSMPRYILVCFPLFFFIGMNLKNKQSKIIYLAISSILLLINTILFIQGYWVA